MFDFQPQNEHLQCARQSCCIRFIKPCVNRCLSPTADSAQCTHLQERLHRRQTVWNHIGIIAHQSQQFKRIKITWRQTIISLSWLSHWFRWFYSAIDHFESFTIHTACVAFSIITFLFSFRTMWQAGLHTVRHHLVEINEFIVSWDECKKCGFCYVVQ